LPIAPAVECVRRVICSTRVNRVLILGPGGSGKSTLARRLGEITGLRVIELDKVFWQPGLVATPRANWVEIQQKLLDESAWIMDGDLGPYDAIEVRLRAADTIIFLDFGVVRCAWRVIRRSRERLDFWLWLLQYRVRSRPMLLKVIGTNAPTAVVHVLRDPSAVSQFILDMVRRYARRESLLS
jgi:adenylate kinase family enzyme